MGYAETASQLVNYDIPPTPGTPEVLLATNLFTNPSFETGTTNVEVRRNLIRYTDLSTTSGWTPTSGTSTSEGGRLKLTQTASNPVRLGYTTGLLNSKPAGNYTASFRAQTSEATAITGVRVYLYDSATATIRAQLSLPLVPGGGDNRYDFALTPNGVFNIVYMEFYGTNIPAGVVGYFSEPLLELSPLAGAFFSGTERPRLRRNLALNPRAVASGANSWLSNDSSQVPVTKVTSFPVPHPLGITTGIEGRSAAGATSALVSIYSIDGLMNTGTPQRNAGAWILVTEEGYRTDGSWGSVVLNPNEWVYVKRTLPYPAGGYATIAVQKITGTASTTVRAYITGAVVEEGTAPVGDFFDGSLTAPAGFQNAWVGTVNASASVVYDTDLYVFWTGPVGASESIVYGVGLVGISGINSYAIRSTRWKKSGEYSLRIISATSSSASRAQFTIPAGLAREKGVLAATVHLEKPISGGTNAYALSLRVQNPIQADIAPNVTGDTDLRLEYSGLTDGYLVQLWHGGLLGSGDVWWDDLALVAGSYGGAFFDGDTQDADGVEYRWTGTPQASTSEMFIPAGEATRENYCDIGWFTHKDEDCFERVADALEEGVPYEAQYLADEAPWASVASGYNYTFSPSLKFLGAYGLSVSALSDSTRQVGITEGILSGGVLGRERLAVPRFRFRVMLTAVDEEGLEYGKTWLSKALSEQSCSTHGPSCGSSDLTFFASCPPVGDPNGPDAAYEQKIDAISRMYHDVKCIEGPITTEVFKRDPNSYGAIVEFTLAAGVPSMFGVASEYQPIPQVGETIVQDIPYNYVPYPSAELSGEQIAWTSAVAPNGGTQITIPTHISPPGGQTTHPSVLDFGANPFNGYRYWMAHTPYTGGNDAQEDPNVCASNDGSTWVVPAGLVNPLDDQPGSPGAYNSDTELVVHPDGGLLLMWRTYNPAVTSGEEQFWTRRSNDGITWAPKVLVHQTSAAVRRLMSPTLIWEDGGWTMWAVDILPSPNRLVRLRSEGAAMSVNGWSAPVNCAVTVPAGRDVWHVQVRWIDGQYIGMLNDATLDASGLAGDLYVMTSPDGLTWTRGATVAIPRSGGTGVGHQSLYRASLVRKSDYELDVWFAGWNTGPPSVWNMFRTTLTAPVTGGQVIVATNYSTNPSLETNATGWIGGVGGNITGPMMTNGRVTGELAAVGTASFRVVFTATGAGTAGEISASQLIPASSWPAGSRPSFNIWAAVVVAAGAPVIQPTLLQALWVDGGNIVLRSDLIGEVPLTGGSASLKSVTPPAGAAGVIVRATSRITSWPAGTVVRLYADALAVTVP